MEGAKIRRRPHWLVWVPRVWVAVVGLFLLWQTITYRGLAALAGEWQFNEFGFYHPALTFLLLLLLLSSPLLLLRLRSRRRRLPAPIEPGSRLLLAIGKTSRFLKTLFGAAVAVAMAALIVAAITLFLPSAKGPRHAISASDDIAKPLLGPAELRGRLLFDKVAVFNEDFWIVRRSSRFAPLVGNGADPTVLRYFIELPPEKPVPRDASISTYQGVLRKRGLPGELINLYRYAGFQIQPDYYVLYASGASMRRSYFTTALELIVLSLFIVLVGAIYRYRRQRLRKFYAGSRATNQEEA